MRIMLLHSPKGVNEEDLFRLPLSVFPFRSSSFVFSLLFCAPFQHELFPLFRRTCVSDIVFSERMGLRADLYPFQGVFVPL